MIASRISKNGEALAQYGIDIKDTNGDLKSTYDILSELAPKWKEMSQEQQVSLGLTLAGTNQYKILSTVLLNFDTAINATNESLNSSGATMKQNSVYMDSLEAKLNAVKAQFTALVNEGGKLNSLAKGFLSVAEGVLKFLNTGVGSATVKTLAWIVALKLLGNVFKTAQTGIRNFGIEIQKANGNILEATATVLGFESATSMLVTGGISLAIALLPKLIELIDDLTKSEDSATKYSKTLNEQSQKYEEEVNNIQQAIDTLNEENVKRETLHNTIKSILPDKAKEIELIEDTNEARKRAIELLEEEKQKEAELLYRTGKSGYNLALSTEENYIPAKEGFFGKFKTKGARDVLDKDFLWQSATLEKQITTWEEYLSNLDRDLSRVEKGTAQYEKLSDAMEYVNNKLEIMRNLHEDNLETIENYENAENTIKGVVDETEDLQTITSVLSDSLKESEESIKNYSTQIDGLQSALETATQAQLEYAENGMLSLDTFQALLDIAPQYLASLVDENGQLAINENSVSNLVNALKLEKIEALQNATAMDILNYATGNIAEMSPLAQSVVDGLGDTISQTGEKALESAKDMNVFAQSVADILGRDINGGAESKIVEAYAKLARQIADINVETKQTSESTKAYTNAQKSATQATNEQTKALKAQADAFKLQKEALQEEVNDYKTVISYITDKINDHINSINDQKDAEVDAIETQIDELEKLADASDEYYDNEIQKLEDLRDLRDDLYADQIDQIKELQDQEKEYWDEKINALKEQNSELETQIEYQTLLENLAKAQESKKMVYREGRGFVYETDTEAVNKARTELANFERKQALEKQVKELEQNRDDKVAIYQKQLDDLTKARELEKTNYNAQIDDLKVLKEQQKEIYTEQINNLNKLKESVTESYNKQAQVFKDYLNKFKEGVNAYEQSQNRLKALQLTGIDFEAQGWQARLSNLNGFVSSYSNKLAQLANITAQYNQAQKAYESAQVVSASTTPTPSLNVSSASYVMTEDKSLPYWTFQKMGEGYSSQGQATAHVNDSANQKKGANGVAQWAGKWYVVKYLRGYATNGEASSQVGMSSATGYYKRYASGVASVKGNQIALVGEAPNQELVFGSRANGIMTSLDNGAGVVNAQSTKTLAGIINQLSNYRGGNLSTITDNSSASNISIGTINLPNVTDGQSFVDYLQNFSLDMLQRAY